MPTTQEANKIDRDTQKICTIYSATRIKLGMELAQRLYEIESKKLYLVIDKNAYPDFISYISSLGMSYYACRKLISLYEAFILVAGYTIEELSKIPYNKLEIIKPELFAKQDGKYVAIKSKKDIDKWITSAKSNISISDLRQLRKESRTDKHKCEFEIINYKRCIKCGLRIK